MKNKLLFISLFVIFQINLFARKTRSDKGQTHDGHHDISNYDIPLNYSGSSNGSALFGFGILIICLLLLILIIYSFIKIKRDKKKLLMNWKLKFENSNFDFPNKDNIFNLKKIDLLLDLKSKYNYNFINLKSNNYLVNNEDINFYYNYIYQQLNNK